ncbi:MAG TPA: hypothetical protein VHC19_07320, partial [Pirellulales bacterium]|nr:hypothetical protein [Pirellulales bacterium]
MSKTFRSHFVSAFVLTVAWSGWTAPGTAAEIAAASEANAVQMETFAKPGDDAYFALKLVPSAAQPATKPHDVVVLFDTSASQTGEYRDKALKALDALLSGLTPKDRV